MEPDWSFHCAAFSANQLERDIWSSLGGCPKNCREAAKLYRRLGVRNLRAAVGKVLGPEISPSHAMRGDIVMAQNALGVCRGELAEFMDRMLPMKEVVCAWRRNG